jgi:hypothetical protein
MKGKTFLILLTALGMMREKREVWDRIFSFQDSYHLFCLIWRKKIVQKRNFLKIASVPNSLILYEHLGEKAGPQIIFHYWLFFDTDLCPLSLMH